MSDSRPSRHTKHKVVHENISYLPRELPVEERAHETNATGKFTYMYDLC